MSTIWRCCARSTASRTITCRRTTSWRPGMIRMGFPERRLVGDLRAGLGEPESAGVRRDLRCARRSVRRTRQLERGIHAGGLSGHGLPLVRRSDHRSEAAGRRHPGAAARAARSAGQAERDRHAEVSRQLGAGGADFVVRAGVPHAGLRARSGGCEPRNRKPRGSCTAWTTRSPSRSAGSA